MKHLQSVNRKAERIEEYLDRSDQGPGVGVSGSGDHGRPSLPSNGGEGPPSLVAANETDQLQRDLAEARPKRGRAEAGEGEGEPAAQAFRPAGRPETGEGRGLDSGEGDVVALQQQGGGGQQPPQQPSPHIPLGCSMVFSPGWEADRNGGTAGLCQPVERDLFDCHVGCFWPAQVPDQLNHAPDWTSKCAAAQKDWRKIDLIFP